MRTFGIVIGATVIVTATLIGAWFVNMVLFLPIGFVTFPLSAGVALFVLFGFTVSHRWLRTSLLAVAAATGACGASVWAIEWIGGSPHTLTHWRVIVADPQAIWILVFFIGTAFASLWLAVRVTSLAPPN